VAVKIFAVGDIAGKPDDNPGMEATGKLIVKLIAAEPEARVLVIGDTAYSDGTPEEFESFYKKHWGGILSKTHPCPGNHEYNSGAVGYFKFFGKSAGSQEQSWYSFDLGSWHIVSLNTEKHYKKGSPQLKWLEDDLTNRKQSRILAFLHRQRWGSGGHGDEESRTKALWNELFKHHAELVLCGHAHHYECFAPQRPDQTADPKGIRQFILGTGGRHFAGKSKNTKNSQKEEFNTFGILELTLEDTQYSWKFIPVEGSSFTHSGSHPTNH
jgi:acid phosphatase type 7